MENNREQVETDRVARALNKQTPNPVLKKELTWRDIKNLSNELSEDQLKQPVRYWTEGEGGEVGDANVLDEDYVSDGESYAPKSEMPAEVIDEDEPVFYKGTVMLWII